MDGMKGQTVGIWEYAVRNVNIMILEFRSDV